MLVALEVPPDVAVVLGLSVVLGVDPLVVVIVLCDVDVVVLCDVDDVVDVDPVWGMLLRHEPLG